MFTKARIKKLEERLTSNKRNGFTFSSFIKLERLYFGLIDDDKIRETERVGYKDWEEYKEREMALAKRMGKYVKEKELEFLEIERKIRKIGGFKD